MPRILTASGWLLAFLAGICVGACALGVGIVCLGISLANLVVFGAALLVFVGAWAVINEAYERLFT